MNIIQDVEWWVRAAQEELKRNPQDELSSLTHFDYMSEYRGWSSAVDQFFVRAPETLEEYFLRKEIFMILLVALKNVFRGAERVDYAGGLNFVSGLNISEAYRVGRTVLTIDPSLAVPLKLRLNRLCLKAGGNLFDYYNIGFKCLIMGERTEW